VLTGGLGKDTLVGGDGNDVYDFNAVAESPAGVNKDVISGFVSGADKIDLSGIDAIAGGANDAFTYISGAAFGGVAGQLRFDVATSTLQGDVSGDGIADFEVQLTGVAVPPAAGDIIV
jgi:Ca2+-binding RTX toxin-like protein